MKRGLAAGDRRFSCLNVDWAALAPDARVVRWASGRLAPYKKPPAVPVASPVGLSMLSPIAMAAGATAAAMAARPAEAAPIPPPPADGRRTLRTTTATWLMEPTWLPGVAIRSVLPNEYKNLHTPRLTKSLMLV